MKNIGAIFLAFACFILSACHESAPGQVNNELSAAYLTSCSSNADCAEGLKCEGGKCISSVIQDIVVPPGGCKTEGDCKEGMNCAAGVCVAQIKVGCAADADCGEGKSCTNGICVGKANVGCVADADCGEGKSCSNGICEDQIKADCVANADCGADKSCANGICVEKIKVACVADVDCGEGKSCSNGICVEKIKVACVADVDCGQGEVCSEGLCIASGGGGDAGNVIMECMAECKVGTVCINGKCVPTSGAVPGAGCVTAAECGPGKICKNGACTASTIIGGLGLNVLSGKIGPAGGGTGSQETGACLVQSDCDKYSQGTVCVNKQCVIQIVNEPVNECEIDGVKGIIGADGKCSVKVKESPIVESIGLKIKTLNADGAGTDAIFALRLCDDKACKKRSSIYFTGSIDHFVVDGVVYWGGTSPLEFVESCGKGDGQGNYPCGEAKLEKNSLDDFFVKISDGKKSYLSTAGKSINKLFTLEDLKKLDHYQIDFVEENGKWPEWKIQAIEISAYAKNGQEILYSSPVIYGDNGYVHKYNSAKFSLKNDLVVVLDVTTANIDNAGTDDAVHPVLFNFNFSGLEKKIWVSSYKNYLVEGKKKTILMSYNDFTNVPSYVPLFNFTNDGDDGWAVEDFKVYIFNPAHNNGYGSGTSDKQFWYYHFEGYEAYFSENPKPKLIAPKKCFNDDGILWLDTDKQDCSSTFEVSAEDDSVNYLPFDDYVK
jgi:Cys-rich repeat protein